jgi:hypothetical protein
MAADATDGSHDIQQDIVVDVFGFVAQLSGKLHGAPLRGSTVGVSQYAFAKALPPEAAFSFREPARRA